MPFGTAGQAQSILWFRTMVGSFSLPGRDPICSFVCKFPASCEDLRTVYIAAFRPGKSYDDSDLTIGERLQKEWAGQQESRDTLTASQQRIKRRKEYMEQSGQVDLSVCTAHILDRC